MVAAACSAGLLAAAAAAAAAPPCGPGFWLLPAACLFRRCSIMRKTTAPATTAGKDRLYTPHASARGSWLRAALLLLLPLLPSTAMVGG